MLRRSNQVPLKYFEDFSIGQVVSSKQTYEVTKEEIIKFARKWDPHQFHTDEKYARDSIFKGLTAPASLVIAISGWLWHRVEEKPTLVAGLGWDHVQFAAPVRPGDRLSISFECVDARPSESKPDCGILSTKVTVTNQNGEAVLKLVDNILVKKRGKTASR
jgi:acyl dehydratase